MGLDVGILHFEPGGSQSNGKQMIQINRPNPLVSMVGNGIELIGIVA